MTLVVRVWRERKWLLPAEEEGEEHHLEAKVEEKENLEAPVDESGGRQPGGAFRHQAAGGNR